ncbi:MAG: hypothetical protein JSS32_03770 [Verrucomicrobia bacterium]|nr:hypothetical protein [Verrucomicrobiota bacterium]
MSRPVSADNYGYVSRTGTSYFESSSRELDQKRGDESASKGIQEQGHKQASRLASEQYDKQRQNEYVVKAAQEQEEKTKRLHRGTWEYPFH